MHELTVTNQDNSWTTGAAVALTAAAGVVVLLAASSNKSKTINVEAECLSSARMNDIAEYLREIDDKTVLECDSASAPPLSVIDRTASSRSKLSRSISNAVAKEVHEQVLRIRYLTIAMIRTGCQLVSWIPEGTSFASPMELWNEVSQFYWDLVFKDGCILSSKLDDNKVKWLTKAAADLQLLTNELYAEWSGSILEKNGCKNGFMCTTNPTFLTALKRSSLSVNFIQRIAGIADGVPFVHFNEIPKTYLCSAILRDMTYSSVRNLKKYCCEEGKQTSKIIEKFEELLTAAIQSELSEAELQKEIKSIELAVRQG